MPLETTQLQSITEPAKVLGQANYWKILGFSYTESNPNSTDAPSLMIHCYAGTKTLNADGVTHRYATVRSWEVSVVGADLQAIAATVVSGALYDAIKNVLYAYLQRKGEFPA